MDIRIDADRLRDRFRGCMVGLACGDSLGMPVETLTPAQILEATGGHGVTGYLAPLQTQFHSTTLLKPGQTTDDTQLPLATGRSLVRMRGFDLADIVRELVEESRKPQRGWGDSVRLGIQELADGVRQPGEPVRDPLALGMGNGAVPRMIPLALFTAMAPGPVTDDALDAYRDYLLYTVDFAARVRELAELTHRDACARIGAACIAITVRQALGGAMVLPTGEPPSRFMPLVVISSEHTSCAVHGDVLYRTIQQIEAYHLGREFDRQHPPMVARYDVARLDRLPEPLRTDLRAFYARLERPSTVSVEDEAVVREALAHNSSDVRESVPFAFATAMAHRGSFRDGVLAAVNAGGDSDSTAAMVGAILGANHGLSAIPPEWVEGLEAHDEIIALADQLFDLVCSRKP
ncbi:MAG: ADP-ribosylglycohydrolase family protein [bacterium]|nr:ADP-ribosylglycohydrolase family protein [bacterium]